MKYIEDHICVFIDAEYTEEHANTTLFSIGLVFENGDELYLRVIS